MFETNEQLIKKQKESNCKVVERRCKRSFKTPLDAIRAKCKECSNGVRSEVENCTIVDCPLWTYRRDKLVENIPEFEFTDIVN